MTSARRLFAVLAVVLAVLLVAISMAPGLAHPAAAQTPAAPRLELAWQSFYVRDQIELRLSITGTSPDTALWVTVYDRLKSRAELAGSLTGTLAVPVAVESFSIEDAPPDSSGHRTFIVKVNPNRLFRAAVYPVRVDLRNGEGTVASLVTHVVRVPERTTSPAFNVALVFPITAPPALTPAGTIEFPPGALAKLSSLADTLFRHRSAPLTIAPTPETLIGLSTADPPVLAALAAAAPNWQVLGQPYVELDIAALLQSGGGQEIERQATRGINALFDTLGVKGSPNTWLMSRPLNPPALEWLTGHRFDQLVMPEEALTPLGRTLGQPTALAAPAGPFRSVAAIDGLLRSRFAQPQPVLGAYHLAAELIQFWFDTYDAERTSDPRGLVLAPPNEWVPNAMFVDTLIELLRRPTTTGNPMLAMMTVDQYFQRVRPANVDGRELVRELRPQPTVDLGSYPAELTATAARLASLAQMSPSLGSSVPALDRLTYVATSADLDAEQRSAYMAHIHQRLDRVTTLVEPIRRETVTLTSRSDSIPLVVRTNTDERLTVRVRVRSPKLELTPDTASLLVDLPQAANQIELKVRTRSSGAFPVDIEVLTPDETILITSTRFTIRSTAVPGVGWLLSVGAGLFLALWWARHLRRQHRLRKASRGGHPTTNGPRVSASPPLA